MTSNPRCVHFHDEGGDLIFRFAVDHLGRRLSHDDDDAGFRSVRAPEFFPVQHEFPPVRRGFGASLHCGRIGADTGFREGEGGDFARRDARKEFAFLFLGAEQDQRLRHADGLMRGEQRREIAAIAAQQHGRATVIGLRQAEPTVSRGHLDPKRTHRRQIADHRGRNLARAINLVRIDPCAEKRFQLFEESVALIAVLGALFRER